MNKDSNSLPYWLCRLAAIVALLFTINLRAGSFVANFDDGAWPPGTTLWGSAFVDMVGGVGDSGALKLTQDFIFGQQGSMIIDDLDGGAPVTSFTAQFMMLIGGSSSSSNAADGLSFNFAADIPDDSIGEEGAGSGLTISFDTHDNGGGEAPAIDIRNGGVTLASFKGTLGLFRTNDWVPVIVVAHENGSLDLTVNGLALATGLPTAFTASPGRFAFGARTGALYDNHWIDNISITTSTEPPQHPTVLSISPLGIGVHEDAIVQVTLKDGVNQVVPDSIAMNFNGSAVAPSISKSADVTIISYDPPGLLFNGSSNAVSLSFSDTSATLQNVTFSFVTRYYLGPTGNIYEFVRDRQYTWEDANAEAQTRSYHGRPGHLATLTSYEEDVFAYKVLRTSYPNTANWEVWIGGFQDYGVSPKEGWHWVNDEGPISGVNGGATYSNWMGVEPNDYFGPDSENYLSLGLNGIFGWNDSGYFGFGTLGGYIVEYEALPVGIDIKHGDKLKIVDVQDEGKLYVALFSAPDFDATAADVSSIRFGRTGTEASVVSSKIQDLNGDKKPDRLLEFAIQDTGWRCGDVAGTLTGRTSDGAPFRGRAGITLVGCPSYSLSMVALQDVHRRTDIQMTIASIVPGNSVPNNIDKTQLKSFMISGKLGWTRNVQNAPLSTLSASSKLGILSYNDLLHFQKVEAALKVLNPKTQKKEVLRGDARVLYRPDLLIDSVHAPSQAGAFRTFQITVGIREGKGDLGAHCDAVLMDGDNVIDSIQGINVAAAGEATLVFGAKFTTPGVRTLKVVIGNVMPGDYDTANNSVTFDVEIVQPPMQPVPYSAYYDHSEDDYLQEWDDDYSAGTFHDVYKNESFSFDLSLPLAVSFPINNIAFKLDVDGVEKVVTLASDIPGYAYNYSCVQYAYASASLGDNIYAYYNSYKDTCLGYESASLSIQGYGYGEVHFSSYLDKLYGDGTPIVNSWSFSYGNFLNAANNLFSRILFDAPEGKYGGDAVIPSLSHYNWGWEYDSRTATGVQYPFYHERYQHDEINGGYSDVTVP